MKHAEALELIDDERDDEPNPWTLDELAVAALAVAYLALVFCGVI